MKKVIVPYEHDSADLGFIYLAVTDGRTQPTEDEWLPAYRDVIDNRRVVWVKMAERSGVLSVWLSDRSGFRRVKTTRRLWR